jgi:hypothetical protein
VIHLLVAWLVLSVLFGLAWQREMRRLARVAQERAEKAALAARRLWFVPDDGADDFYWWRHRWLAEERIALTIVRPESYMVFGGTVA